MANWFALLFLLPPRFGKNCVTGLRLSLGAVEAVLAVLVLGVLPAPNAEPSPPKGFFSSSSFSSIFLCCFLRRQQKSNKPRRATTPRSIPKANPAFAPPERPPLDSEEAGEDRGGAIEIALLDEAGADVDGVARDPSVVASVEETAVDGADDMSVVEDGSTMTDGVATEVGATVATDSDVVLWGMIVEVDELFEEVGIWTTLGILLGVDCCCAL